MPRETLPPKRKSETHKVRVKGMRNSLFVNIGRYPDGRIGEIFIDIGQEGTEVKDLMQGFARMASLALQYGATSKEVIKILGGLTAIPKAVAQVLKEVEKIDESE